ncbi:hypothetical protein [Candidatus Clostridium radicumherbarum]|uniref:YtzI protein n=1 Tax=Candidatus Clostridium radicumherbarum TaxID=3381662 RepID=A0ABW8TUR8_9CLOT
MIIGVAMAIMTVTVIVLIASYKSTVTSMKESDIYIKNHKKYNND